MWDAILGAGASLLGGIFGGGSKTETHESVSQNTVNFKKLVRDSTAAGFNPLTVVRNGGMGGYVRTYSKGSGKSSGGGGASIGAGIADAVGQIAPLFGPGMGRVDPIKVKNKTTGAISPLVSQQLRGSTLRAGSVVVAPRQTALRGPRTVANPAKTRLAPYLDDGKLTNTDVGKQTVWWESDPNRVDGAQYEDAYGEFVGGVLGVIPAMQDTWHNAKRGYQYADRYMKRKTLEANYRVAARRPWLDNRPPPPKGFRYAN